MSLAVLDKTPDSGLFLPETIHPSTPDCVGTYVESLGSEEPSWGPSLVVVTGPCIPVS